MTKIDENAKRTIYKRKGGLVSRPKTSKKSNIEKWEDKMEKDANKFDKNF
jgi:hypothetical protein